MYGQTCRNIKREIGPFIGKTASTAGCIRSALAWLLTVSAMLVCAAATAAPGDLDPAFWGCRPGHRATRASRGGDVDRAAAGRIRSRWRSFLLRDGLPAEP